MSVGLALVIVIAGVGVGAMSAFFGVGGGLLMVPLLVLVLGETQHIAEGTSLAVIVPTAIAGVVAHNRNDLVSFRSAAWLGAGGVLGAVLGARIALGTSGDTLRLFFGFLVIAVGIRFTYQGIKEGSSKDRMDTDA
jgi:uncharacterized protein